MALTARQTSAFWRLFSAACAAQGLTDRAAKEEYRHTVMREEAGVLHLQAVTRCAGFERIMARLAADAGDFETAIMYGEAEPRRLAAQIEDCIRQICEIKRSEVDPVAYVSGILSQAKLATSKVGSDYCMDIPSDMLGKVFMMLDTHRRRVLSDAPRGENIPAGFRMGRSWLYDDLGLLHVSHGRTGTSPIRVEVVRAARHLLGCFQGRCTACAAAFFISCRVLADIRRALPFSC